MPLSTLPWPDYLVEYMKARVACCIGRIPGTSDREFTPALYCKHKYLVGINDNCEACGQNLT